MLGIIAMSKNSHKFSSFFSALDLRVVFVIFFLLFTYIPDLDRSLSVIANLIVISTHFAQKKKKKKKSK